MYMSKNYINKYIVFCKNQNFKSKYNNKTIIIMKSPTRNQCTFSRRVIIFI